VRCNDAKLRNLQITRFDILAFLCCVQNSVHGIFEEKSCQISMTVLLMLLVFSSTDEIAIKSRFYDIDVVLIWL